MPADGRGEPLTFLHATMADRIMGRSAWRMPAERLRRQREQPEAAPDRRKPATRGSGRKFSLRGRQLPDKLLATALDLVQVRHDH
jgi:hypothetical protein